MLDSFLHWPLKKAPHWQAKWIAPPGIDAQPNVCFRVRKKWGITSLPPSSFLHIAAESRYRLYVNGREIGLGPARGTRSVNYFDTYDIASLLVCGENWIGAT